MKAQKATFIQIGIDVLVGVVAIIFTIIGIFVTEYPFIVVPGAAIVYFLFLRWRQSANLTRLGELLKSSRHAKDLEIPESMMRSFGSLAAELEQLVKTIRSEASDTRLMEDTLSELATSAEESITDLALGFAEQRGMTEQATGAMTKMSDSLKDIATKVEALAEAAEESSSSILEMTTTNEEVAENMSVMGNSVRETVSSIGEMAYSIKEVADNIDALSATAEGTSSAMNQMDISIDQVQSNADETTTLSGEVSKDAELGAEAISKTTKAINRIEDSSRDAVEVISSLGKKIEEIGHILNVIDDVAEQTNLLALNAAIIAAQAGEHGKGFAVVADEIKELAERTGVSTKEISELIKAIQSESRRAISSVEQGNTNVDEGVVVSAQAEEALRKILESANQSTDMMSAIARATVEQARGSKQVTDAIGRIAETVQQIAAATSEQARGSELIIQGAEKMRSITQHVERSTSEQAKGGHQVSKSIESISQMVNQLNQSHREQYAGIESIVEMSRTIDRISERQEESLDQVKRAFAAVAEALRLRRTR